MATSVTLRRKLSWFFCTLFTMLLCFWSVSIHAQTPDLWREVPNASIIAKGNRYTIPTQYKTMVLSTGSMRQLLQAAPHERALSLRNSQTIIVLPLPDGNRARFRIVESTTMAPELAARFPQIKTYQGIGVDDRRLTAAIDITPAGFHAMIHSTEEGLSFIDPYSQGDVDNYIAYYKKDYNSAASKGFSETDVLVPNPELAKRVAERVQEKRLQREQGITVAGKPSGDQLRTYRIAIAATGEYTVFHGGTVSNALSAIVTTLNRVNFIYIREVAIRMVLIANNSSIIYTNGATDPYSNGNAGAMLGQNQTNLTNVIGSANYDIGHVFGTNSGGVAGLGVVCNASFKGWGVTGSGAPVGDGFDVDYVAHEIGHQFGANHTFNGNEGACAGNRNASTAFEPGSGSTIMGYSGICGSQNLQFFSDAYFHVASYDEIFAYSEINGGSSCAVITNPVNTAPVPTILTTSGLYIPRQTPFTIAGTATDFHGDPITYNWEEYDLGPAGSPLAPSGNAPIFRSFTASSSGARTFPRMSSLLNNTSTLGELLPSYTRTLRFNLTVRDNYSAGGGVNWAYPLIVNVAGTAGPFVVTAPNTNVNWAGGGSQTINWSVAGTNLSPINCSQVNIWLSTNGGLSYPYLLAGNTPNDGSQTIAVPNLTTTTARIRIEAVGNIFFDISNVNFRITATPAPVVTSIRPANGPIGMGVCIQGDNFINVSAIRFNGVTATQTYLAGPKLLYATVPSGATTGKIQVVAQGGSVLSATNFTVGAVTSPWVAKAPIVTARLQHGTLATNGKIYVFGGRNGAGVLNSLEIYNPATNTWSTGAPMPLPIRGMANAVGSNGSIYTFGGVAGAPVTNSYRYNPATNSWSAVANIPVAVFEAAAAATPNGKIYVFGGEPPTAIGTSVNTTRIYNIATNSWSTGASMPVGVQQHSAITGTDGKIYVIGGRALSANAPLGLVQIYNPVTNTWAIGANMLIPKVQFGAVRAANGRIYVVGGKAKETNSSGPFFNTVEIYTPATNSWSFGPVLPIPYGQQTTVNLNDNLYAVGGSNATLRNNVYQLTLAPVAPSSLVATVVSSSQINLKWTDNSKNETGFIIERALTSFGPFSPIASVGANVVTYKNTGLSAATTYFYRVKANNLVGNSPNSNMVSAKTLAVGAMIAANDKDFATPEVSVNELKAFPNPARANNTVKVTFTVNQDQQVHLDVFDMSGKVVRQLFRGTANKGQTYVFDWNAGIQTPGMYVVRLITNEGPITQKVVLTP